MKKLTILLVITLAGAAMAARIPSQITYQGTLKERGVPVNGSRTMLFRLTNENGSRVYWSSGNIPVTVTQGLFAAILSPSSIDWQQEDPLFIEISVAGQLLIPREPVTANAYAFMSGSVIDGAVSREKLNPAVQDKLMPSGLIALFAGACPSGWTRFGALDGRFPIGGASYGSTGGSAIHTHSLSTDGAHNHGSRTGDTSEIIPNSVSGDSSDKPASHHWHSISTDGAHNHGGATGSASSLPPYLTFVFCQKT